MTDKSGHCEFVVSLTWQSPTLEKRDHHDAGVSFLQYAISFLFSGGIPLLRHSQNLAGNPPPSASFPKSSIGNPKVFLRNFTLTLTLSRQGRGEKKGDDKGEFFPPYTGGYFPTSFFILLSFIFCLRRRLSFMFSSFWGL